MTGNKFNRSDIFKLLRIVWLKKTSVIKSCTIAALVAVGIAFSIPKTFQSTVVLAPEFNNAGGNNSFSSLASFAGIDLSGMNSEDALYPELYPQIVSSTEFMDELMQMNVKSQDGVVDTTLFSYISAFQEKAWWTYIYEFPNKLYRMVFPKKKNPGAGGSGTEVLPYKVYSESQISVINKLRKMINCSVDVGNNVVTINANMQDPVISAQVANKVADLLQEKVTLYRTNKSQKDFDYSNMLYEEAKQNYHNKQDEYYRYLDKHALGTALNTVRAKEDRMKDEVELAYTVYCQVAQQRELSKAKVQEVTPVFSVLQPAVVPVLPVSPQKMFILVAFVFLTFFGHVVWIIYESKIKALFKKNKNE